MQLRVVRDEEINAGRQKDGIALKQLNVVVGIPEEPRHIAILLNDQAMIPRFVGSERARKQS